MNLMASGILACGVIWRNGCLCAWPRALLARPVPASSSAETGRQLRVQGRDGGQKDEELRARRGDGTIGRLPSAGHCKTAPNCSMSELTLSFHTPSPATVRPPPDLKFYFVTSWVLFLEGLSGISGLAVSYFYKNTLKVDPATLTQVMSMTNLPWTCKPIYGFVSDAFPIMGYRQVQCCVGTQAQAPICLAARIARGHFILA